MTTALVELIEYLTSPHTEFARLAKALCRVKTAVGLTTAACPHRVGPLTWIRGASPRCKYPIQRVKSVLPFRVHLRPRRRLDATARESERPPGLQVS